MGSKEDTMRLFTRILVLAFIALASSAFAADRQTNNLNPGALRAPVTLEAYPVRAPVSMPAPGREPEVFPLRCGFESGTTPGASISILGPDENGKYKVPFSIWFPVPAGTTFTGYAIHSDGTRVLIDSNTVTAETAGGGWAGNMWGPYTGGAVIPEDVVGFRLEFTGAFPTYSVNTKVPDSSRIPALVDVYPNGLFLRVWMCPAPVVSLRGRVHSVVNGWITPTEFFTGPDIPVAVCSGFPDSECLTQEVDIPKS